MRHGVFCDIDDQILKNPVRLLAVQPHDQLMFRQLPAELQIGAFYFAVILQPYLLEQIHDIHLHKMHGHAFAGRLADFKQIFDQHLQPERFALQNLYIFFGL